MATRTFVGDGASHNWSTTGAWVEGSVPTAADDVVFSSNTAGSILVIDGTSGSPSLCRSMDCTGYTRTITQASGKVLTIGDSSGGSLTLVSGMTYSPDASSQINFVSTTTGNTLTSAGKTLGNLTFNGAGGAWTLQDNLSLVSAMVLTAGSLNDNGKTVTVASLSSSNSNTRALTISGAWTINDGGASWNISTSAGMTLTATGSTITFTGYPMEFRGGGLAYASVVLAGHPSYPPIVYGTNTFVNLTYSGTGLGDSISFAAGQTVTGTLTITGSSVTNRILIKSNVIGTSRTLDTAANSISNADLQDINGAGASGWNLSAISGNSGNCGGCSNITFTTPINCYMKTATSTNWAASNWYTTSGGSTPARVPLPQDTAIFDANSITAGSVTIGLNLPRVSALDWTGVLNSPNLQSNYSALSFFGNITLVSGMTTGTSGVNTCSFENRVSMNLGCNGASWVLGETILNAPGGTLNLTSNYTGSDITVTSGTWSNGSYTMLVPVLSIDGGIFDLGGGLVTCSYELAISGGMLEMNGNDMGVGSTPGLAEFNMSGGDLNLSGSIGGYPDITVSGGTINDTGSAGELTGLDASFTGGVSEIRNLTLLGSFTQSSTSSLTIVEGATWTSPWTWSGTSFTFTTAGIPTWSAGTLTVVPAGSGSGGSWTFC
jgi:hypothetical protein